MGEFIPQSWEGDPGGIPVQVWSDVPLVKDENDKLDGDVKVLSTSSLIKTYGGDGFYRRQDIIQTPSNISRGES